MKRAEEINQTYIHRVSVVTVGIRLFTARGHRREAIGSMLMLAASAAMGLGVSVIVSANQERMRGPKE